VDVQPILDARLAHPFRPFYLVMSDGKRLSIDRAVYLAISPDRKLLLYSAKDGSFPIFSPQHVSAIEFLEQAKSGQDISGSDKGAA
jgi:hypothetical protein